MPLGVFLKKNCSSDAPVGVDLQVIFPLFSFLHGSAGILNDDDEKKIACDDVFVTILPCISLGTCYILSFYSLSSELASIHRPCQLLLRTLLDHRPHGPAHNRSSPLPPVGVISLGTSCLPPSLARRPRPFARQSSRSLLHFLGRTRRPTDRPTGFVPPK